MGDKDKHNQDTQSDQDQKGKTPPDAGAQGTQGQGQGSDNAADPTKDKGGQQGGFKLPTTKEELEAWGNTFVQDRLARARKQWEEELADQQSEAERESLKQQQKYQELYEQVSTENGKLKDKVKELTAQVEDLSTRLQASDQAMAAYAEGLRGDLDKPVLELLEKMPVAEQLEWLTRHRPSAEKSGKQKEAVPPTPKGDKDKDRKAATEEEKAKAQESMARSYQSDY